MKTLLADTRDQTDETIGPVRIQAIETGHVRVRAKQIEGRGHGIARLARTFLDREWSPWLPIYCWLIEHPEGLIMVDTGETARTSEPGYLPSWHPYYRSGVEFDVEPAQEVGPQLRSRGIDPLDVRTVVLTHLHTDHAGGLAHFPESEVIIGRREYELASGIGGRVRGFLPQHRPVWLRPNLVDITPEPYGPFENSLSLTRSGDVVLVPTPGHTAGQLSVIVRIGTMHFFLAGDTSYTEALMVQDRVDGVAPDEASARRTLAKIRDLAASTPLVYLPSHDPDSAVRLENEQAVY